MANWDQVYKDKNVAEATPARVLLENQHLLPLKGKALDYASGLSGNGIFMASKGLDVSSWDLSEVAVNKINQYASDTGLSINAQIKNLENNNEQLNEVFDVVVVSFFLHRESFDDIEGLLKSGGILFYQTFSGKQKDGVGPSRADYRLKQGELLNVFKKMKLLSYREDIDSGRNNTIPDQVCFVAQKL